MNMQKEKSAWMFRTAFVTLLASYLVFSTLEEFFEGFVSRFFNLNWLLLAVLISAFPVFGATLQPSVVTSRSKGMTWLLMAISSFVTTVLIFFSADAIEIRWRMLLAAYGGLMTAAILLVLFEE
ncbi:MAG: hypothetical protein AAB444_02290 [Patescibacteria group bacterium]